MENFLTYLAVAATLTTLLELLLILRLQKRRRLTETLVVDAVTELAMVICTPGVSVTVWRATLSTIDDLDNRSLKLGIYR